MKNKNKLITTLVVGTLLLLSISIKATVAAPPTWVGVEAGDKYSWTATVYFDAYVNLYEDMTGETYPYPSQPDQSVGLSIDVLAVSDELYDSTFDFYWVNVTVIMTQSIAGEEMPTPPVGLVVPRNDTSNYFATVFAFFNNSLYYYDIMYIPLLIVAPDLNWSKIAEELNFDFPEIPEMPDFDVSVSVRTSGLGFNLEGIIIDGRELDTMNGYIDYNKDGVLKSAVLRYGGAKLISLSPPSEDQIPGYEIHITLGIMAACSVGLIIYFKKKK